MFNTFKRYNVEVIKNNTNTMNDIIYKVTTNTLLKADAAIQHIKRNKKIYKNIVLYFAICMAPDIIMVEGRQLIIQFIRELAQVPQEFLLNYLCSVFSYVLSKLVLIILIKDITVESYKNTIHRIKNNL